MPAPHSEGMLAAARARVAGARAALQQPRAVSLDTSVTLLREAQGYLEWLRDSRRAGAPASPPAELRALAAEIRQAGILLEEAVRRGRRWLERLEACAGYTAAGTRLPLQPRAGIAIFG